MHTTLSTAVDEKNLKHSNALHPQVVSLHSHPVRRVGLVDRVALHVGLALVTWSRRPAARAAQPSWTDLATQRESQRARVQREHHWLLVMSLSQPRR